MLFGLVQLCRVVWCAVVWRPAEFEVRRELAAEAGGDLNIPQVERFDSNIITPVGSSHTCCDLRLTLLINGLLYYH
jgi:hypothetical protein